MCASDGPEGRRSRSDENRRGAAVRREVGATGGGDAARRTRLRLVRRYEVFSGVMNAPMAHAPALVEAWGGKTGDISGVVPAMPGGHVGDVCGCCTPGSVPCLL